MVTYAWVREAHIITDFAGTNLPRLYVGELRTARPITSFARKESALPSQGIRVLANSPREHFEDLLLRTGVLRKRDLTVHRGHNGAD